MKGAVTAVGPPVDAASRVDDHGTAGVSVTDQIARVGQTVQVVLTEEHVRLQVERRFLRQLYPRGHLPSTPWGIRALRGAACAGDRIEPDSVRVNDHRPGCVALLDASGADFSLRTEARLSREVQD